MPNVEGSNPFARFVCNAPEFSTEPRTYAPNPRVLRGAAPNESLYFGTDLKGSLAPIAPISRSQVQESRISQYRGEDDLSRARSFARVAR